MAARGSTRIIIAVVGVGQGDLMKVGELIHRLQQYDSDLPVVVFSEDEGAFEEHAPVPVLTIAGVEDDRVDRCRGDEGLDRLHFVRVDPDGSETAVVAIETTAHYGADEVTG